MHTCKNLPERFNEVGDILTACQLLKCNYYASLVRIYAAKACSLYNNYILELVPFKKLALKLFCSFQAVNMSYPYNLILQPLSMLSNNFNKTHECPFVASDTLYQLYMPIVSCTHNRLDVQKRCNSSFYPAHPSVFYEVIQ